VLSVDVSGDLSNATVYVSIMGNQTQRKQAYRGLVHATGFLQARVAARLQTRFTPVVQFKLDDGVKKSVELARLIDEAVASDRKPENSLSEPIDATPVESIVPHSTQNHAHGNTK
jgi:ribosome-binding factor A